MSADTFYEFTVCVTLISMLFTLLVLSLSRVHRPLPPPHSARLFAQTFNTRVNAVEQSLISSPPKDLLRYGKAPSEQRTSTRGHEHSNVERSRANVQRQVLRRLHRRLARDFRRSEQLPVASDYGRLRTGPDHHLGDVMCFSFEASMISMAIIMNELRQVDK